MTEPPALTKARALQALEEEAWRDPVRRALYSTRDIPGFPWYTVLTTAEERESVPTPDPPSQCASTPPTTATAVLRPEHEPLSETETQGQGQAGVARRHVIPHDFTFQVFVKGRWVGRGLVDVYASEFTHHSREYYTACLRSGRLRCLSRRAVQVAEAAAAEARCERPPQKTALAPESSAVGGASRGEGAGGAGDGCASPVRAVRRDVKRRELKRGATAAFTELDTTPVGGSPAPAPTEAGGDVADTSAADVTLGHGDVVLHTVHRHEIPIAVGPSGVEPVRLLSVCIEAFGLLSVWKPTGLPVHATGRYAYNSLLAMLEYVLAPSRLHAWLRERDPLLQSLVCTDELSEAGVEELYRYYHSVEESIGDGSRVTVALDKCPRACHRLDKATSGVLLLATSQSACQRVSVALMEKTRHMEAAIRRMGEGAGHSADANSDGGGGGNGEDALESVQQLVRVDYGLRKRYLAKVLGQFPADSPRLSAALGGTVAEQRAAAVFALSVDTMDALNGRPGVQRASVESVVSDDTGIGKETANSLTFVRSSGVAVASPIGYPRPPPAAAGGGAEEDGHKGAGAREERAGVALTVFQPVRTLGSAGTVLQCIPFTGRLHQIRAHLGDCGLPIVGDVEHGFPRRGLRCSLYYTPHNLPRAYQAFTYTPSPVDASLHTSAAALPGETASTTAQPALTAEPPCYECARRLPIASVGEKSGASAICLHAWRYEVELATLVAGASGRDGAGGASATVPSSRYVSIVNGIVTFSAPPPTWAVEA